MLAIYPIPALDTNYFWLLHPDQRNTAAYILDPGAATPVIAALESRQLTLSGIIITHHHHDHIGGIDELVERFRVPVYGPRSSRIPQVTHFLEDGDCLSLPGLRMDVWAISGHTQEHLAFLHKPGADEPYRLFCGDTLFAAGCGRLLDGTAEQLYASLVRLAQLPDDTLVYCSHEYTLANLRFAQAAEPDNTAVAARLNTVKQLRSMGQNTLPTTIGLEKATNPFLRVDAPSIRESAEKFAGRSLETGQAVFTALRQWKDVF